MSDDLEPRSHHAITHDGETYIKLADASVTFSLYRKDIAAKDAEIARLRAAINNALLEPWLDGQLNGTWQQEPIGPNETPEEAIKRLVSVRAEWAVYKNNCENPVIAELRAAIATARLVPPLNPDRWRGAINDALTNWMDSILDDETPKDALRRLIQYEITAALDPAVSQSAADLVATARREGMEMPPEFLEWVKREMPSGTHIHNPEWWASRVWKAAIRAAAQEVK